MKKTLITLNLLMLSPFCFALNLVDAYERAKNTDPAWQANIYQYEADQTNLGIARSYLLPMVTVSGNITKKNQETKDSSSGSAASGSPNLVTSSSTIKQASVTLRQPLFQMDKWLNYKRTQTTLELSEVALKLQKQQHLLNVAEAYFNVLRQQTLTLTQTKEESALLQQLKMMNAKLREGLVAKSDVSEANAQYQNARANRIATGVQLILAQEQLAQLIGPYKEKLAVLRDDFHYQKPIPSSLKEWVNLAESQNLDVLQARLQLKNANDQRKVEQAARLPQIDAIATYGYTNQTPETAISSNGQFDQFGVEMYWNIFTGGRTQASINKAKINVKKSDSQLDAVLRKATTDVKKSFLQVETDQSTLQARKTAMESSALVSKASQAQYNEGLKSIVDVLLAQRNAFATQQQYVNTQFDYIINVLRLKSAIGQLNEAELVQMNAWLTYK